MSKQQEHTSLQPNQITDLFGVIKTYTDEPIENKTIDYVKIIMSTKDMSQLNINWPKYLNAFYNNHMQFNDDTQKQINKNLISILTKHDLSATAAEIEHEIEPDFESSIPDDKNYIIDTTFDSSLDHLKRFMTVNGLINILNELNSSHDQILNYTNYTKRMCQDYYLRQITKDKNSSLIKHWFLGIFRRIDLDLFDGKHKVPYYRAIEILKQYLEHQNEFYTNNETRDKLISNFISIYSKWSVEYLSEKFNKNELSLSEVFNKLNKVNNVNKLFIELNDRGSYLNDTIIGLVKLWKSYLDGILNSNQIIDENIISTYNSVNLSGSNFNNITLQFCEKWQNEIKNIISPCNYGSPKLFNSLKQICPLIAAFRSGHNKSDLVIKYFSDIYTFESNLIGYVIAGLSNLINNIYNTFYTNLAEKNISEDITLTSDIMNTLILISLFDNKEMLWSLYFNNVSTRIREQNKKYLLNPKIINFEFEVFNYLVYNAGSYCDKTKTFLTNIKNSVDHVNMIRKCKIKYINNDGNSKLDDVKWKEPDLSKVDYNVVDKHIWELENTDNKYNYQLIDSNKYPADIQTYFSVGKTYYDAVSETRNIDWDVENSVINYNVADTTIISTILQYTLITQIANKQMTKDDLINSVLNNKLNETSLSDAKKYLESIIKYMCNERSKIFDVFHDGTLCLSNKLNSKKNNRKTINLTKHVPTLLDEPKVENISKNTDSDTNSDSANVTNPNLNPNTNSKLDETSNIIMTKECIVYLRMLMLIKMFKSHSTKIYSLETIISSLDRKINKYINIDKFDKDLIKILKNLTNISEGTLLNELKYLEKRDIIEFKKEGTQMGYTYVV